MFLFIIYLNLRCLFYFWLCSFLDENILKAIEKLNYRVSIYDIILETGLDSQYVEAQLSLLLYKTKGNVLLCFLSIFLLAFFLFLSLYIYILHLF